MLVRLVLNSRPQVIRPPWPPKCLDYRREPPRPAAQFLMRSFSRALEAQANLAGDGFLLLPLTLSSPCPSKYEFRELQTSFPSSTIPRALPFQLGPSRMAPAKKGDEKKKGRSAINQVVTGGYTISTHKRIHGVGFKRHAPRALREIRKIAMKEMGSPGVYIDTRLNKAVWAKGIRNVPYRIRVPLSRKRNEDEESLNKLHHLVTYVVVTTFKNLQTVNVAEN
ncbi:large ribosomal subunit protein eL31-like [Aotus nancymaae]|uniref:large ribosomal subunit protein eL31-like n=1 Tax=Aotus nancymaae TaxID=37293 RepID=UPI0030FEFC9A